MGHCDIYEKIGSGCYGQVYRGKHNETNEDIAIKVIDLFRIKSVKNIILKRILTRLSQTEDLMMIKCDSPNVVKCLDVFQNKDIKIIVMEYCNQGSLEDELKKRGIIHEKQAILIIKQIINGITVSLYLFRKCTHATSSTEISSQPTSSDTIRSIKYAILDFPKSFSLMMRMILQSTPFQGPHVPQLLKYWLKNPMASRYYPYYSGRHLVDRSDLLSTAFWKNALRCKF